MSPSKIEGGLSLKDMDTDAVVVILGGTSLPSSRQHHLTMRYRIGQLVDHGDVLHVLPTHKPRILSLFEGRARCGLPRSKSSAFYEQVGGSAVLGGRPQRDTTTDRTLLHPEGRPSGGYRHRRKVHPGGDDFCARQPLAANQSGKLLAQPRGASSVCSLHLDRSLMTVHVGFHARTLAPCGARSQCQTE